MNAPLRKQPICNTDPARRDGIDLNALAQEELRLESAPLSRLIMEHSELNRWLNMPGAELWRDQHREKSDRLRRIWQTIKRRFPEYAARSAR